jgi:hypothetical protein
MKNTPLYRVYERNVTTGQMYVPSRYMVGTKVYSRKADAIRAAKRITDYPYYVDREGVVMETETNWLEVPLDKSLDM